MLFLFKKWILFYKQIFKGHKIKNPFKKSGHLVWILAKIDDKKTILHENKKNRVSLKTA